MTLLILKAHDFILNGRAITRPYAFCLLYTSDAADDLTRVDLGGRRIIKKNFFKQKTAYEITTRLVGSEMCIRDRAHTLAHLGLTREQCIAFGDGGNDVTMLEYAGIGVAMGNACEEAKATADYVTDDIMKDGLAKALEHFGLI